MPMERKAKNVAAATSRKAGVSTRSCATVAPVIPGRHYPASPAITAPRSGKCSATWPNILLDTRALVSLDL
jgi:hypothetical protein